MDNSFGFHLKHFNPWEGACYCANLPCSDQDAIEEFIEKLQQSNDQKDIDEASELAETLDDANQICSN